MSFLTPSEHPSIPRGLCQNFTKSLPRFYFAGSLPSLPALDQDFAKALLYQDFAKTLPELYFAKTLPSLDQSFTLPRFCQSFTLPALDQDFAKALPLPALYLLLTLRWFHSQVFPDCPFCSLPSVCAFRAGISGGSLEK